MQNFKIQRKLFHSKLRCKFCHIIIVKKYSLLTASVKGILWSTFELTQCPCQPFLWYPCQRMEESCKKNKRENTRIILCPALLLKAKTLLWITLHVRKIALNIKTTLNSKPKVKQWEKTIMVSSCLHTWHMLLKRLYKIETDPELLVIHDDYYHNTPLYPHLLTLFI